MASTTALLKSAASRREKIRAQEDALVAFNWSQSEKTYDQFLAYTDYLNKRLDSTLDPSKALSYTKDIVSARKGYTSNEIQRQTQNVLEGRNSTSDKFEAVKALYFQAQDNGDYDLALSLRGQLDRLNIQQQNENDAAQRAAGTLAMNGVKQLGDMVKLFKDGNKLIEMPDGTVIKPLAMLNNEVTASGDSPYGYFAEARATIQALTQTVYDAYQGATTQDAVDAIAEKYGDIIDGTKGFLKVAGQSELLNAQDIELAYRSALANNPLYSPVASYDEATGQQKFTLKKNAVDDFVWIRNDDGTYQGVQTRTKLESPYQNLDTKITNEGYVVRADGTTGTGEKVKTDDTMSIGNRLKTLGIQATNNSDGTLTITLPTGEQFQGVIQPDGNIRYFGEPGDYSGGQAGLYEINLFTGDKREVSPDETSSFGTRSVFGGNLSNADETGKNIMSSLSGILKPKSDLFSPMAHINGVDTNMGLGTNASSSAFQGATSKLLQDSQQLQKTAAAQEVANNQQIQKAGALNLNQTPVPQTAVNGAPIRQLTVQPVATPRVTVAAPTPAPSVKVVTTPAPGKVTVDNTPNTTKLVVR